MKLVIKVNSNVEYIDEVFNTMRLQKQINIVEQKTYAAIMKAKNKTLFHLIRRRIKKWVIKETKNSLIAEEIGNDEYVRREHKSFQDFMMGTEKQLTTEKEYQQFKNDRFVHKIYQKIRRTSKMTKNWAIKKALGEGRVMDFFNSAGITIVWSVHCD